MPTPLRSGPEAAYTLYSAIQAQPEMLWLDNLATGSQLGGPDLHAILTASGEVRARVVRTVGAATIALRQGRLLDRGRLAASHGSPTQRRAKQ